MIGANGNTTLLPPRRPLDMVNSLPEAVIIKISHHVGATLTPDNAQYAMKTEKYVVKGTSLNRRPVYIKELGLIIANDQFKDTATHPASLKNIQNIVLDASKRVCDTMQRMAMYIVVNDPKGVFDSLYTSIGEDILKVDVIHEPDPNERLTLCLTIRDATSSSPVIKTIDISTLYEDATDDVSLTGCPIQFISKTEKKASEIKNKTEMFTWAEVDEMLKKNLNESTEAHQQELREKDNKIKELDLKCQSLTNDLSEATAKITTMTEQISTAKSAIDQANASAKSSQEQYTQALKEKKDESDWRASQYRESSAASDSKFKTIMLVAGATVPIAALIALEYYKHNRSPSLKLNYKPKYPIYGKDKLKINNNLNSMIRCSNSVLGLEVNLPPIHLFGH